LYIVVCLCSDDFRVARRKAKKAEQTSDLDTAASEIEKESRKRRAKAFLEDDASVCSVPVRNVSNSKISKKGSGKKILFPAALLTPPPPPAALFSSPHILVSTSTPSPSAGYLPAMYIYSVLAACVGSNNAVSAIIHNVM